MDRSYEKALKARAVQDFFSENSRSPTTTELRDLLQTYKERYPTLDIVGFTGYDAVKPQFKEPSSALVENTNRKAVYDDLMVFRERINTLNDLLEDSYRTFQAGLTRTSKLLDQVESRANNLLLLSGDTQFFNYGVEETFSTQELIDLSRSNVSVESGFATLSRRSYSVVPMDDILIDVSVTAEKGVIGFEPSNDKSTLKKADGSVWESVVTTAYRHGRVVLVIDMTLPEATDISQVKLVGRPIDSGKKSTVSVLYSLDGKTWVAARPVEQEFYRGENLVSIGVDGVKKIRVLVTKLAADDMADNGNDFVYVYSIDTIQLIKAKFKGNLRGSLYAGPYTVLDEMGAPVYFTRATIETCQVTPEGTSVSMYLSPDGETWTPVSSDSDSLGVVSFGSQDQSGTYGLNDTDLEAEAVLGEGPDEIPLDHSCDGVLNKYVLADSAGKVSRRSIEIRRNTAQSSSVYGVPAGWYRVEETGNYRTTIYVEDDMGSALNLGSSTAILNGREVSGRVAIPAGYTTFETSSNNWIDIDESLVADLDDLKDADPLYPYNHKYLIEGFPYGGTFTGEKKYSGVGTYFGSLLRYVPPEMFGANDLSKDYGVYTIEDLDQSLYFKVKVNKSDSSWDVEKFDILYRVQSNPTNELYVKAVLESTANNITPKLKSYKVRVI